MITNMLTTKEAATICGVSPDLIYGAVRRRCIDGAVQVGRQWLLPLESVKTYVHRDAMRQRTVLEYVSTHRAPTLRQIAAQIGISSSATFALVGKMIEAGALRRDEHGTLVATVPYLTITMKSSPGE